ncbi:MAG: ribosome silencing factor [Flavobacteriales bacterium]|jgi:ribosome-associated protein|nr:ribosome silencing factor [Flavobacteriales bacterium]|tara:strand:- start:2816 stop:3184 length:369 start_codon:yes stop_codon:yes gene_type:complete
MTKNASETDTLITKIIKGIKNVKGVEIDLLDLRVIENTVCDYFLICNGTSNTHVKAIVSSVQKTVSKSIKEKPFHIEGEDNGEWVLIDYIDVVVHVFQKQVREHYNLKSLWGDAISTKIVSN